MSHMLTSEVPEKVYESLLKAAKQTGQPLEKLAVQWLTQVPQEDVDDLVEQFIGAFNSRSSDRVEQHDTYLGDAAINN